MNAAVHEAACYSILRNPSNILFRCSNARGLNSEFTGCGDNVMKNILLKIAIVTQLGLASNYALACLSDRDCGVDSKCVKLGCSLSGHCMGGMRPGNRYDEQAAYNPMGLTGQQGNTCSFDTDCGVGGKCAKGSSLYGTCL